ncbi:hypothetical protein acsn021_39770 [Anaerocolumna cellulosilytica]|uniref:Uncharacterized protein n=1 Tax=Anaerocolumna cellulosilytica TaxID=433286 RepID=A0A6S6RC14_9FIRM|nr:hypothetical protein [Anaerocolumna cellulosilytica]MBB5196381.1 hypothetical protein [Anaerocolumna cellulosilytica]BCJ96408.1 hypothetical protein acsn021_39770 [Anaerocolumna cellulosilytica]
MTDKELAEKYAPHLYFDRMEPFRLEYIGYQVIRSSMRSPSFKRDIWVNKDKASFVIEYQLYFDYDIQHMYDLEHFWVYVDNKGKVCDGEASAHGRILNCFQYLKKLEEDTHIPLYVQPGKHALLPESELFKLFSDYKSACQEFAGLDGLLIADMFQGKIMKNKYIHYKVCEYIREKYSFAPSMDFYIIPYDREYIPWTELCEIIPRRINTLLEELNLL